MDTVNHEASTVADDGLSVFTSSSSAGHSLNEEESVDNFLFVSFVSDHDHSSEPARIALPVHYFTMSNNEKGGSLASDIRGIFVSLFLYTAAFSFLTI